MSHACTLTTKDYTILEVMYERCLGRDDPLRPILEAKLSGACVMFREDIPPTVVTLSSRVAYRIDGGSAETRIITHGEVNGPVGGVLSITLPRDLALLGLAEGQSFTIARGEAKAVRKISVSSRSFTSRRRRGVRALPSIQ